MNKEVFLQKAQEYIGFEQDPFFRDQVVKLVEEKNFTELSDRFYTEWNLEPVACGSNRWWI